MRQTSMMILYCITIWANLGKPVFKICVQKHSTHRFPALPVDVTALLDSADPKLKGQEVICSQLIRANKSGTPAFISGVPLLIYLQEAGSDNSISLFFFLFFSDFNPAAITWILPTCPNAKCLYLKWRQSRETRAACISGSVSLPSCPVFLSSDIEK